MMLGYELDIPGCERVCKGDARVEGAGSVLKLKLSRCGRCEELNKIV
jgi:hypothetical protein